MADEGNLGEAAVIDAQTELYGIIGNPVRHTLSPIIHNGVFKRMGLNAVYLAFEINDLKEALNGIRNLGIRGVSVTIPFKTQVIPLLDQVEDVAWRIQAVNTIKNEGGKLIGYNTDWCGALEALEEKVNLKNKRILLLGAGGAARAIAFGLKKRDCQVLIYNRSLNKAKDLAQELGFFPLSSIEDVEAHVIINATSVGMHPHDGESPLPKKLLKEGTVVMDIVYQPLRTELLREAEVQGCRTIDGLEMLARQGAGQLEIWTGRRPEINQIKADLRRALDQEVREERRRMIEIKPLHHCDAVITIHGSKSYTHRALIVSALADGESVLVNALRSDDTEYTLRRLEKFGIPIFQRSDGLHVLGKGGRLEGGEEGIYVGNSGTSMRFLTALSALKHGRTLLDGNGRMRKRPMGDLLKGLSALGVRAYSKEKNGCPPVIIESQGFKGGKAKIKGEESSQFLSALLMIAPYAQEDVHVEVTGHLASKPYVDITLNIMSTFGVKVESDGYHSFFVRAGQRYLPQTYRVEGDASNASYFFAAAAITKGRVRVENFCPNSVQGDAGLLAILEEMGCEVIQGESWAEVRGKELRGIEVDMNGMPDLVPSLAVTAAFAKGETTLQNIGHLRLKESDRIKALALELGKMGIRVKEGKDWLKVKGGEVHGAEIETHEDHRLAMSFAIAGLAVPGVKIRGERCVDKSFPGFWEVFQKLYP